MIQRLRFETEAYRVQQRPIVSMCLGGHSLLLAEPVRVSMVVD